MGMLQKSSIEEPQPAHLANIRVLTDFRFFAEFLKTLLLRSNLKKQTVCCCRVSDGAGRLICSNSASKFALQFVSVFLIVGGVRNLD